MTEIKWDEAGSRRFQTGVDHGVLYQIDGSGEYVDGVAWNGLTTVTESPSGAEANKQYADNRVYANLLSAEEFGGTIEAFYYPDEFAQNDGSVEVDGVLVGQQGRKPFGFAWRTLVGDDLEGTDKGYKIKLAYGCQASPSEQASATVNDSPEAAAFSWAFTTTPVAVTNHKPSALLTIDSTKVDATHLGELEDILYGTSSDAPRLPLPDEVLAIFGGSVSDVDLTVAANQPSFNSTTGVLTLPAVTGVQWKVNGVNATPGVKAAVASGVQVVVNAVAADNDHNLVGDDDWTYRRD